jgi:hypothetical protein
VQLADSLFDQGTVIVLRILINSSMTTSRPRPHPPVSAPQEATLDSAFLLTASNMHAAKARAMKAGAGAFDIDDFVSKLITFMGGRRGGGGGGGGTGPKDRRDRERQADGDYDEDVDDEEEEEDDEDDEPLNWERIGRKALAKSRRIPVMDFMCVACLRCFSVCAGGRRVFSDALWFLLG